MTTKKPFVPKLELYATLDEEFQRLLEEGGLNQAAAKQLAKLAKGLLRNLKKSLSSILRVYLPKISITTIRKKLNRLIKRFDHVNQALIDRIRKMWDKRRRLFVICDDYLLPRYGKKGYRVGKFRDPVQKRLRYGHNIVDTVIAMEGLEVTYDFAIQPKNSRIPKTKRALKQVLQALSYLRSHGISLTRIRVLMDGGYTNRTVLSPLREQGVKYIGTAARNNVSKLFGKCKQLYERFSTVRLRYRTVHRTRYFYKRKTLNLTAWGRHQVFQVQRGGEKDVKYYITNDLKMTPQTFLECLHERWWVEQNHRDLKQVCGMKQLFVRSKSSVQGVLTLSNLLKNFLTVKIAEAGLTLRDYPLETLVENEFVQVEQELLKMALEAGFLEKVGGI